MSCLTIEKENITNPPSGFNNEVFHHDFQFSQSPHVETSLTKTEDNTFCQYKDVSNDFIDNDHFIKENKTFIPSKPVVSSPQNNRFRRSTLISSYHPRSSCISDEKTYDRYPSPYKSKRHSIHLSKSTSDLNMNTRSYEGRMSLTCSDGGPRPKPIRSNSFYEERNRLPVPNIGIYQTQRRPVKKATLLPCYKIGQKKIKYIDHLTMCKLLRGEYNDTIDEFCIIDCRYDYEYSGGHIKGSLNFESCEEMLNRFFSPEIIESNETFNNTALIFHCEFSIKRGPNAYKLFRNHDRKLNTWPSLRYPHIYVLEGGYSKFFEECKEFCTPCSYVPMKDEKFKERRKTFEYFEPVRRSKSSISLFKGY